MERVLMSRQPICYPDLSVFGYELLFRDSDGAEQKILTDKRRTRRLSGRS
jgi:c-di-GMP-related signal transduction protein